MSTWHLSWALSDIFIDSNMRQVNHTSWNWLTIETCQSVSQSCDDENLMIVATLKSIDFIGGQTVNSTWCGVRNDSSGDWWKEESRNFYDAFMGLSQIAISAKPNRLASTHNLFGKRNETTNQPVSPSVIYWFQATLFVLIEHAATVYFERVMS